ncbi:MAG: endonuclease-3 [Salinirussus sp.]|jgi:endonuclease-3
MCAALPVDMDVRQLHRDLVALHGKPAKAHSEDGVRQLVTTVLSQNVTDQQTARAADELFRTYPDYRAIEEASHEELADTISAVGLMNQKADRIQRALGRIRAETGGEYTLAFLEELPTEEAQDWLTEIKGIGPKTASVVLNFHFERPTFAVDTHIERLSTRFGLIDDSTTAEQAHEVLNETVPDDIKYSLHVLLIGHGKEYCTARSPDCDNPVCVAYCDCQGC